MPRDEDFNKRRDLLASYDGWRAGPKGKSAPLSEKSEARNTRFKREQRITNRGTHDRDRIDARKTDTYIQRFDKKQDKVIDVASRETSRGKSRKAKHLRRQGNPRRVWRHQEGTTVLASAPTDECNFSWTLRSRKSTGSRKRDRRIRETRERGTKLQPDARPRVCSRAKKRGLISTHDRERLMLFDESRDVSFFLSFSLSCMIVRLLIRDICVMPARTHS